MAITISNSLGKIIQFQPSLPIKPLVAITYFVIPTLSGGICCGGIKENSLEKTLTYTISILVRILLGDYPLPWEIEVSTTFVELLTLFAEVFVAPPA